jgi:hypothetical protein
MATTATVVNRTTGLQQLVEYQQRGGVPFEAWLSVAIDMVSRIVPPQSTALQQLAALRTTPRDEPPWRDAVAIVQLVDTFAREYQPDTSPLIDNATAQLNRLKEALLKDLAPDSESGTGKALLARWQQTLGKEASNAITDQIRSHPVIRILFVILGTMIAGFLGVNYLHAKYVQEAKQAVEKMQEQLNGAKIAIFDKQSELNKVIGDAQRDLAAKSQKDVDWVKGTVTQEIKDNGAESKRVLDRERDVQLNKLQQEATTTIGRLREHPYLTWLVGWSSIAAILSLPVSLTALFAVWLRTR